LVPDLGYGSSRILPQQLTGIKFPVVGDLNGDCTVNMLDIYLLSQNWLSDTWYTNVKGNDSITNLQDYGIVSGNWLYSEQCD
jgi:hypothetical protein